MSARRPFFCMDEQGSGNGAGLPKPGAFKSLFLRDVRLGLRRPVETAIPVGFCLMAAMLFAFGTGPDPDDLRRIASGVVWTTVLLAMVVSVETMFSSDHEDGTLDLMLTSPSILPLLVAAKVAARWVWSALPVIAVSPLVGYMMGMPSGSLSILALSLVLGTPTLFLLGAFGASLVLGQRRGAALLALLVLPLCVPVLIFASGLVHLAENGLDYGGAVSLLGAMLALALTLMPMATAAVLSATGGHS